MASASSVAAEAEANTATITGRAIDAEFNELGVEGVRVVVEGHALSAVSDETGAFVLPGLPDGPLVLRAQADDYAELRVEVSEEERQRALVLHMVWVAGASSSLTLAAGRERPETVSTTRLSARDIEAAPRRNAEEILRQVPGMTLVQHGSEGKGYQYFLRGFDAIHGADLELTLKGVPLNEWSNVHAQGYLDLGIMIPELVREVRVTKGPFSLEQGAFGMAGSAEYRLGVPASDLGWRAAYTVGTTNRHRVFAGYSPRGGTGGEFVGIEATHDESFGMNRSLDRATFNGRVRLAELRQGGSLHLMGLAGVAGFEIPGTLRNDAVAEGSVGFFDAYDTETRGASARALLALEYEQGWGEHRLSLSAYGGLRRLDLLENFTGFLSDPVNGDRRDQAQKTASYGVFGEHSVQLRPALRLRSGLGVRGDVFEQHETHVGRALEPLEERRDLSGHQLIAHALSGVVWNPHRTLRIDAGARLDLVHVRVRDHLGEGGEGEGDGAPAGGAAGGVGGGGDLVTVSPRVSARWRPNEAWTLSAAYGRGFRPPEARAFSRYEPERSGIGDDVYTGGKAASVVSDAGELGARWEAGERLTIGVTGFVTRIERESIFDHVSGVNLELNGTRRVGGELVVDSQPSAWLRVGADLTVVDARFLSSGNPVPFAPRLVFGARMAATHPSGFRAGLRVLALAPRSLPHGAKGAPLVMTDATLGYDWRHFRIGLELENLLNRRLREGEYHYASHWRPESRPSEIPVLHTTAGPPLNARLTLGVQF